MENSIEMIADVLMNMALEADDYNPIFSDEAGDESIYTASRRVLEDELSQIADVAPNLLWTLDLIVSANHEEYFLKYMPENE